MEVTPIMLDKPTLLGNVQSALERHLITEGTAENLKIWLTQEAYADYAKQVAQHIDEEKWSTLDDVFWTVIPFGTGGRRGRMYPIGSNAINDRTIGESAQGLAAYVRQVKPSGPWSCGIAYDTRHRSREFAELCAGIMVANGFKVFFIDEYRSTPQLSFLVRFKRCDCGIMVTASHNPPSDNAVKVYWSNGAQLIPPHDKNVIAEVAQVTKIEFEKFEQAVQEGKIEICTKEIDSALLEEHIKLSHAGPRNLRVIFSPLHGVGEFNVKSLLNRAGFDQLEIFEPHREPNGDFPNVPGHVSNPENPEVFSAMISHAQQTGADLILASDPDCDRMGAAAPQTLDASGAWQTFNGNQLAVLLANYVLETKKSKGELTSSKFIVTTLVTTSMLRKIAEAYGVQCYDQNLVGFKWICNVIDQHDPNDFLYGTEESHGYLVGTHARDKDGAIACLLMCELAAQCKQNGITLFEKLDQLYQQYGFFAERLLTIKMEGSDGMRRMQSLMNEIRKNRLTTLASIPVSGLRDYQTLTRHAGDGSQSTFVGPKDNLIFIELGMPGNCVAARPSGTEPKIKMYMFAHVPPSELTNLDQARDMINKRFDVIEQELSAFAATIE
ncbi:MAG TPA: phospho-sugar mutase [Pirellulaceae bacterium]|nr:phospho-sugar mutase [Pirellulaceae bacterium]HMO90655.1 phospho-sugar mutase [Pirellulaceae bacterium]HMP67766.1 phospho-sugar mutase [Pirellulaceae bacterium]